ncbi:c-type cytochrome [Roseovarius litoreus]|uniref:c-type cytochrome n=1 Tax=Roseovarius litoreus TaxID=1155722 RepID=UPI00165EEDEE|nr:cytochrome c [Roseovarius litoreus]
MLGQPLVDRLLTKCSNLKLPEIDPTPANSRQNGLVLVYRENRNRLDVPRHNNNSAIIGYFMKYSFISLGLLLLGCAPSTTPDVSREAGKAVFSDNCSICHGTDANGAGPWAASLETPPVDLTKIADRRDGVWPMLEVMSIIDGYSKRTELREDMPILVGLVEGPKVGFDTGNGLVTPTPARLIAVANYLESIQSPQPTSLVP